MTTATKPPPPHGIRARYLRGCQCDECRDAHYRYMSRWRLDDQRGQRRRTDPGPALRHVQQLLAAGWLQSQIADAAGMNHRNISALLHDATPTISRSNADRILAIPNGPAPQARDVDATGTIRRIRALVAIGHPIAHIADQVGIHPDALGVIARGRRRMVRATTADAVTAAYRHLSRRPGRSARARTIATRRDWAGPLAWDADAIDDPAATPELDEDAPTPSRIDLGKIRRAEIAHLDACHIPEEQIAQRVGLAPDYVHDLIRSIRKAA